MDKQKAKRIAGYLFSKKFWVSQLVAKQSLCKYLPDKAYLKLWYYANTGNKLNLKNPQTYREKLQWLKLYDRNPLYPIMVDKYAVKKYVAERIGEEYIIPTLGVWDKVQDIDWDGLPNQFVLKCTHDSGGIVICRDKSTFDKEKAVLILKKALNKNYYYLAREWPYKHIKPKVLAESYMEDEFGELRDYKFFCFNGKVRGMFIATGRYKNVETCFDFFDADFNHLPFTQGHPNAEIIPDKPKAFDEMKKIAAILSKGIPEVRIDFYDINGHVFFGEFTFFHFSGIVRFDPPEWDYTFGSWIKLPN